MFNKTIISGVFCRIICVVFLIVFLILPTDKIDAATTRFNVNLTLGSKGQDVVALQNFLISRGRLVMPTGVSKGTFGTLTRAGLAGWQKSVGIRPAVGYFGPITRARLNTILFPAIPTPPPAPPEVPIVPPPTNTQGFSFTCSPNTSQILLNGSVTWTARLTGLAGNYTYRWDGTDGLVGSDLSITKNYTTIGSKTASITINGQYTFPCSTNVNVVQETQTTAARNFSVNVYRDQTLVKYADRAIAWFTIGGRSPYMPYRLAWPEGYPLPTSYWTGSGSEISSEIALVLNNGYQRMFLHNPFGQSPRVEFPDGCIEEGMLFDQYLEASKTTPWLVNNFVEAWRPITNSGVEVIAYIGSPDSPNPNWINGDCEQMALRENPEAWWARAWQVLQPFLDSGMSIGLDASVVTSQSSFTYQLAQALSARGVRVYVESYPSRENSHWAQFPVVIMNTDWWFSREPWAVPYSQLRTEVFRGVHYPEQEQGTINQILSEGDTAGINWRLPLQQAVINFTDQTVVVDLQSQNSSANVFSIKTNPAFGQLTPINPGAGKYLYTANSGYTGPDTFTYTTGSGSNETLPGTVAVNVNATMPFVNAQTLMNAARQAGGGSANVVAIWPLFEKDIQNLGIQSMVSSNMVPKRVITFQIGGSPTSYIAGYDKNTFAPMAVSAGRLLVARADNASEVQYAAATESKTSIFNFIRSILNKFIDIISALLFN